MSQQWFYKVDGKEVGPVAPGDLRRLANWGQIKAETPVRRSSDTKWATAIKVRGLFDDEASAAAPADPKEASSAKVGVTLNAGGPPLGARKYITPASIVLASAAAIFLVISLIYAFSGSDAEEHVDPVVAAEPAAIPDPLLEEPKPKPPEITPKPESGAPATAQKSIKELVLLVDPSVVTIEVSDGSLGSGFIAGTPSTVVTNFHVVDGAERARVKFHDGRSAQVLGFIAVFPGSDLVLLQIGAVKGTLRPLPIATTDPSRGERVLAFGSPRGLEGSVSEGIVSGMRDGAEVGSVLSVEGLDAYKEIYGFDYRTRWVQTTAPISPGNSGGPLVDGNGVVVGVNSLGLHKTAENVNFSVSYFHTAKLLERIGDPVRPLKDLPESQKDKVAQEIAKKKRSEAVRLRAARSRRDAARIANQQRALNAAEKKGRDRRNAAERQLELSRLNDRIRTVRSELALVESDGLKLRTAAERVNAKGKQVYTYGNRLNGELAGARRRINVLNGAIQRRELARQGGPIIIDGVNGTAAQLRIERQRLQFRVQAVLRETARLDADYAGLKSQLAGFLQQLKYKDAQKRKLESELAELQDRYDSFQEER